MKKTTIIFLSVVLFVLIVTIIILSCNLYNSNQHLSATQADLDATSAWEKDWQTPGHTANGKVVVQGDWLCYETLPAEGQISSAGVVAELYEISHPNLIKYEKDTGIGIYTLLLNGVEGIPDIYVGKCSDGTERIFFRCGNYWVTAPEAATTQE